MKSNDNQIPLKQSAIASLAILKVNFEVGNKDYIDNFIPFIVECIRTSPDDAISLPALQGALVSQFTMHLPLNPLRQILQRASKKGYLKLESGIFYRIPEVCSQLNFSNLRQKSVEASNHVIGALKAYAEKQFSTKWSDDQTEQAFMAFVNTDGLGVLYSSAENTPISFHTFPKGSQHIVGSFISESYKGPPSSLVDDIETIIKGSLLANALYLPDHGRIEQKFQNTHVYLDTRFLVYALGYAGQDRQAPCAEVLGLLQKYGAELRAFQETVEEVRGILNACAAKIRRGELRSAFGPTIEYFIGRGMSSTDIDLLEVRVPQRLAGMNIGVEEKPPYEKKHLIGEGAFEAHLQKHVGYRNPQALKHDVDCVSAIARLRSGRESYSIETCRAIFVTTNSGLARETRSFFQADSPSGVVALCVSDYALGNLLWLKSPTQAPDLPRGRIIADAYAAMTPSDDLWKKYLVEIARFEEDKEISADDYSLLRYSHSAKAALMDLTKGDPDGFTQGSIPEILEVAKRNLRSDIQEALDLERTERIEIQHTLAEKEGKDIERIGRIRSCSNVVSKYIGYLCFIMLSVILGWATLSTFPWSLPSLSQSWLRYVLGTCQALLFVYTLMSIGWGTSLRDLTSHLQKKIASSIETWVRRKLHL